MILGSFRDAVFVGISLEIGTLYGMKVCKWIYQN